MLRRRMNIAYQPTHSSVKGLTVEEKAEKHDEMV